MQGTNPFRIGIWCDGEGLSGQISTEFIGALADGLLDLDQRLEVILFVRPEDSNGTTGLPCRSEGRLQVVPLLKAESGLPGWMAAILGQLGPWFEGLRVKIQIGRRLMRGLRSRMVVALRGLLTKTWFKFQKSPAWCYLGVSYPAWRKFGGSRNW